LAAAQASHGDDAALADQIAKGRSAAMSAGRVDQGGAGFGFTFGLAKEAQALHARRQANEITDDEYQAGMADINSRLHKAVLESQGPGTLLHPSMKESAVRELIPAMRQRVQNAMASGDQDQIDRELAIAQSLHDELARTAPNKARIVADELLKWDVGDGKTVQVHGNERRGSQQWQTTHKEFQDSNAYQNAQAQQNQTPQDPGAGPTMPIIPDM
jgi:hypothetical protein